MWQCICLFSNQCWTVWPVGLVNLFLVSSQPWNLQRSKTVWLCCKPGLTMDMLMRRCLMWPEMDPCRFDRRGCSVNQRCRGYSGARRLTQANVFEGKRGRRNKCIVGWVDLKPCWKREKMRVNTQESPREHRDRETRSESKEKQILVMEWRAEAKWDIVLNRKKTKQKQNSRLVNRLLCCSLVGGWKHIHIHQTSQNNTQITSQHNLDSQCKATLCTNRFWI